MKNISQAVILCGGLGTRLKPLTNATPKPMLQLNNKPFLWYLLDKLSAKPNNIKRFLLLTGYLEAKITSYFKDGKNFGWDIKYNKGPISWDTGQRVWEARELIDEKFLLCYSDNFVQVDINKIYEIWERNGSVISLLLQGKKYGNAKLIDKQNNIIYKEKRNKEYDLVDLGFMVCNKRKLIDVYRSIPNYPEINFSKILQELSFYKKISGYLISDFYHSIGDLDRLKKTEDYLKPKKIILLDRDGVINEKAKPGKYITLWENFIFIKDTIDALQNLSSKGFQFIIITNQAGIATGDLNKKDLFYIHKKMIQYLKNRKIKILDIFVSEDHWNSNNFRRKPNPGMFYEASKKYNFRLDKTFYIGDDPRDSIAANRASCGSVIIGKNSREKNINADLTAIKLSDLTQDIYSKFLEYNNQIYSK